MLDLGPAPLATTNAGLAQEPVPTAPPAHQAHIAPIPQTRAPAQLPTMRQVQSPAVDATSAATTACLQPRPVPNAIHPISGPFRAIRVPATNSTTKLESPYVLDATIPVQYAMEPPAVTAWPVSIAGIEA